MGETAADTRAEIERTRSELGATLSELRSRTVVVRGRVVRVAVIAAGTAAAMGATVAAVVVLRHRRGGPITRAAKNLPEITHGVALPIARASERWVSRRAQRAQEQREQLIEAISIKIAENQAQAQRRANPLWRRAAGTAIETAASLGVAALIRRAMSERASRDVGRSGSLSAPEKV